MESFGLLEGIDLALRVPSNRCASSRSYPSFQAMRAASQHTKEGNGQIGDRLRLVTGGLEPWR